MAETNSSLGFNSKLQIVIVPKDKNYATPADKKGKLIFREGTNIIEVNGHEYQAAKTGDLSKITEALKNTGYLTESNGVLTAEAPGTVAALLGTKISTAALGDEKTVSAWIDDILGQISGINTNISNLQKATETDGTGNFVVRDKSGEGKTDFANTTAIQKAINTAKNAAITKAASDAAEKDTKVKTDLIGNGKDSASADSTPLKPGSGYTWAQNEAQQKNLSHLKDLLVDLQGQLDTLTGTDLNKVNNAIKAIEKELTDGSSGLTTIIDGLKVFLGSGLNTGGATHTVGGTSSNYTLQEIITALEGQITAVQSKHSVVEGGNGSASDKNYAVVTSSTTNGKTTYTVQTSTTLDTAISNAKTTISTVGGTVGTTNYITVTKSTSGHDNYTIKTTSALDTVAKKAAGALPKGSSQYDDAAALESGLKGNLSSDTADFATIAGAKKYADSKSAAAQSNAEAKALSYANNVITWTVIS